MARDPEKLRANKRRHYEKYRERYLARQRERYREFGRSDKDKETSRDYRLKVAFGITFDQKRAILETQHGKCAICSLLLDAAAKGTCVDHDHETGRIRGVLCGNCNRGIGFLKDSPEILESAIRYLKK